MIESPFVTINGCSSAMFVVIGWCLFEGYTVRDSISVARDLCEFGSECGLESASVDNEQLADGCVEHQGGNWRDASFSWLGVVGHLVQSYVEGSVPNGVVPVEFRERHRVHAFALRRFLNKPIKLEGEEGRLVL